MQRQINWQWLVVAFMWGVLITTVLLTQIWRMEVERAEGILLQKKIQQRVEPRFDGLKVQEI